MGLVRSLHCFSGHYFITKGNTFSCALVKMSLDGHSSSSVYQFLWNHHSNYYMEFLEQLRKFNRSSVMRVVIQYGSEHKSSLILLGTLNNFCPTLWHITGIFLACAKFRIGLSHILFHYAQFWKTHDTMDKMCQTQQ